MKKEIIIIDNLKCGGCANSIRQMLLQIDGTKHVDVELDLDKVLIEHDGNYNKNYFAEKLAKLGYPEKGTSTAFQKAKSYISCAKGRLS